ncbi:MAG: hypothetical protein M0P14_03250 [Alkaliphilus sp.]|nr:hypothetical protein [Alkaliphilus sp.]
MRRVLLVTLLVILMLTTVGFTSEGASYWEDMKEIYEWNAIEGKSEAELDISIPSMDIDYHYKIDVNSQSNFDDFSSYLKMEIKDVQGELNIPVIEMYTYGSDIYINKEAVLALLAATGAADDLVIEEEYVVLESGQKEVDIDFRNVLNEMIEFVDKIDLGMDLGMEKEGDTYTLTLESDELLDLLDAYMRYIFENIDQLPDSLVQGQEIELTEEEKQQALKEYDAFVDQYKDMAKIFIKGSKFYMEGTFEEDKYIENSQLEIKVMDMGELNMNVASTSSKLEKVDFELPTSVMRITAEELAELIMGKIGIDTGAKVYINLDGTYVKFDGSDIEEGRIPLQIIDNLAYITIEDAEKLFDVELEGLEDPFHMRKLDDFGFRVDWNEESRVIEVY